MRAGTFRLPGPQDPVSTGFSVLAPGGPNIGKAPRETLTSGPRHRGFSRMDGRRSTHARGYSWAMVRWRTAMMLAAGVLLVLAGCGGHSGAQAGATPAPSMAADCLTAD